THFTRTNIFSLARPPRLTMHQLRPRRQWLHRTTSLIRVATSLPQRIHLYSAQLKGSAVFTIVKEKYMGKLEGKIALITGGNSGIGLATAKQFVNEGAYVFITGRRDQELAQAVREIGRNVTGVQGDVSNLGDLDRIFAQIKREKGKLDIVFANAGGAKFALLGKITEEHYDSIFNGNVKGLLFTVQKALPLLPDGGSIILNASVAGSTAPSPEWSVYNATKAAVRSFARTWTTDLKDRRIRVNAVSPGYVDTPPWHSIEAAEEHIKYISR